MKVQAVTKRMFENMCVPWLKSPLVIVKDQYSHLEYPSISASNNKSVKTWTQLVIEVAREKWKEKTPMLHKLACSQMPKTTLKDFRAFNIWERNYLFLKNYVTFVRFISCNVLNYQQLSVARLQSKFLSWYLLSYYQ